MEQCVTSNATSAMTTYSLEDILEFDTLEPVVTAFEQQMSKSRDGNKNMTIHENATESLVIESKAATSRKGRLRKQFGRAATENTAVCTTTLPLGIVSNNDIGGNRTVSQAKKIGILEEKHLSGFQSAPSNEALFIKDTFEASAEIPARLRMSRGSLSLRSETGLDLIDIDDDTCHWPVPTDLGGSVSSDSFPIGRISANKIALPRLRRMPVPIGEEPFPLTLHQRSQSLRVMDASDSPEPSMLLPKFFPSQRPLSRSETLPSNSDFFQMRGERISPRRRRVQRSLSLCGKSPNRSTGYQRKGLGITLEADEDWLLENLNPSTFNSSRDLFIDPYSESNDDSLLSDYSSRFRKRIRARRHSVQGDLHLAPLTQVKQARAHTMPSDPNLDWLIAETASPSPQKTESLLGDSDEKMSATMHSSTQFSSPSNRSIASSRKRGACCGTPPSSSDHDDWSIAGYSKSLQSNTSLSLSARQAGGRTRVFSPAPDSCFPPPPMLAARQSSRSHFVACESDTENRNRTTAIIPPAVEDSDDESSSHSSTDASMDTDSDDDVLVTDITTGRQNCLTIENVFQNLSSYDDLKFIIKALRKENDQVTFASFGVHNTWDVPPPLVWNTERRNNFFKWACQHLGFSIRAAGMSINYVQISKAKGIEVLSILEAALLEYKQKNHKEKVHIPMGNIVLNDNPTVVNDKFQWSTTKVYRDASGPSPMQSVTKTSKYEEEGGIQLMNDLELLTLKESTTLDQHAMSKLPHDRTNQNFRQNKLRTSMGSHCTDNTSNNLMLHLHGVEDTPIHGRWKATRPPKLSIDSFHSSVLNTPQMSCTLTPFAVPPCLHPIQNLEFLATPLMNEPKGWGSQPIVGKDWGGSEKCDEYTMEQLAIRFDETGQCEFTNEILSCVALGRSTNTLEFEIETSNSIDEENSVGGDRIEARIGLSPFQEKKFLRKRVSEMNKRRRMSIWATMSQGFVSSTSGRLSGLRKVGATLCPSDKVFAINNESSRCLSDLKEDVFPEIETTSVYKTDSILPSEQAVTNESIMSLVFSFLNEKDLVRTASSVCISWADMASTAHARLIFSSFMGESDIKNDRYQCGHLERSWKEVHSLFPWACFLAEGGAKRVYKVYNRFVREKEALSVMDTYSIQNKQIVANELAISVLLGSLTRRGICPNFVKTRGFFTSAHIPSDMHWGGELNKNPKGDDFDASNVCRIPREPRNPHPGRYQYIRMELVNQGDAEETIKRQPHESFDKEVARAILFQVAFALHVAADKFSFKHYDLKLLNVFLQKIEGNTGDVVMRYGLGSHMFALRMPSNNAFVAKLADFGTANIDPESNGQPLTIAQFTTLENTPPDFMILGDDARQGHGHDNFGLGLCMLHLFTGAAPYEEILEEVRCPSNFKRRLRLIWESDDDEGFSIVSSLIQDGVVKDEAGHVIEGEPDETLYNTLYRHMVLFGIPEAQFKNKKCTRIWNAISDSFPQNGFADRRKRGTDVNVYKRDCKKFSILTGTDFRIRRARGSLQTCNGGMELLFGLCSFDPIKRISAIEVLNSQFMEPLREVAGTTYSSETTLFEYTAFSTHQSRT